jgi:inner membrane protein involved in colicin E2 resistance
MKKLVTPFLIIAMLTGVKAQDHNQANYDESKVPAYTLPDVLKTSANKDVKNKTTWER